MGHSVPPPYFRIISSKVFRSRLLLGHSSKNASPVSPRINGKCKCKQTSNEYRQTPPNTQCCILLEIRPLLYILFPTKQKIYIHYQLVYLPNIDSSISTANHISDKNKHCQKHNGLEGWVLLTKITSFVISKFLQKFWSNFISIISTKHQLQNLNQISAFWLNLNFKILTKPSFRISTKIKLHNLHQASTAKYWPKFSFKISPEF